MASNSKPGVVICAADSDDEQFVSINGAPPSGGNGPKFFISTTGPPPNMQGNGASFFSTDGHVSNMQGGPFVICAADSDDEQFISTTGPPPNAQGNGATFICAADSDDEQFISTTGPPSHIQGSGASGACTADTSATGPPPPHIQGSGASGACTADTSATGPPPQSAVTYAVDSDDEDFISVGTEPPPPVSENAEDAFIEDVTTGGFKVQVVTRKLPNGQLHKTVSVDEDPELAALKPKLQNTPMRIVVESSTANNGLCHNFVCVDALTFGEENGAAAADQQNVRSTYTKEEDGTTKNVVSVDMLPEAECESNTDAK